MGVYIRGMEMPKSCSECNVNFCDGRRTVKHFAVERSADCPLVPVPPHGRLIDGDAFDERIRIAGGLADEELSDDFKDGIQTTLLMLKTQRTIILAEEGET